jgi:hypothetical protein
LFVTNEYLVRYLSVLQRSFSFRTMKLPKSPYWESALNLVALLVVTGLVLSMPGPPWLQHIPMLGGLWLLLRLLNGWARRACWLGIALNCVGVFIGICQVFNLLPAPWIQALTQ